jgi:regulator of sigma E protease
MTPVAWLVQNGVYLLVLAALVVLDYRWVGPEGLLRHVLVVLGLGFLIFVHELGHFLAAKWCDVHVQTFSIGFGPALPGCSFQRGETTYKIAVLPLGGYVNMVGEGPEAEEDEDYPRSFRNKTVGQRMLIISAGVFMNVLVAAILFVIVYMYRGDYRPPAIVGTVDPGSPIWDKGIHTGSVISKIDGIKHPYFDDLKVEVVLSPEGEAIAFTFVDPSGKQPPRTVNLLPRKEKSDPNPVIGLAPPLRLQLPNRRGDSDLVPPVQRGSAAAAARPLGLQPGEVVTATTDPADHNKLLPLPDTGDRVKYFAELGRRLRKLAGEPMVIRVRQREGGPAEERAVPAEGFTCGDTIVGMSRPPSSGGAAYDPFRVEALPPDPRNPESGFCDVFEYFRRLDQCRGLPIVVQVRREGAAAGAAPVDLFVPPAYHWTFGMRMKMGAVAALRENSAAALAGLLKGDLLVRVEMKTKEGKTLLALEDLDPERLPYQLRHAAAAEPGPKVVVLAVKRPGSSQERTVLPPADWDDSWDYDIEEPLSVAAPLPVPQLGLAYYIEDRIVEVKPGSPAQAAGLQEKDRLEEAWCKFWSDNSKDTTWSRRYKLYAERGGGDKAYDCWARIFYLVQQLDFREWRFTVSRPDEARKAAVANPVEVSAEEDETWPLAERGLKLMPDYHVQKAAGLGEALAMGTRKTVRMIVLLYLQLRSLATGRVDLEQVGGPIELLSQTSDALQAGPWYFLLILAVISINLAVVNFLPIPVLDGGHMVFLIYEKLRGRPPSETVRAVATYIGLAAIFSLMIFVFYQDIRKRFLGL